MGKKPKTTKWDPFTRGVGKDAKAREKDKQKKLKHVPNPQKRVTGTEEENTLAM